jgi:hypothetical protein
MRPSPVLCTRSPTPATVLIAARHAAPTTCTPRDKQTQFSERNKGKRKTNQNPDSNSNLAKSMTQHNQTKELTTWFLSHQPRFRALDRALATFSGNYVEGPEKVTRGGEWVPIKILMQELTYVLSSNPKAKILQESDEHTNQ